MTAQSDTGCPKRFGFSWRPRYRYSLNSQRVHVSAKMASMFRKSPNALGETMDVRRVFKMSAGVIPAGSTGISQP